MRVICCVCEVLYDVKEPFENDQVSHGYCELCWPWVEHNLRIELAQISEAEGKAHPKPNKPDAHGEGCDGVKIAGRASA